MNFIFFSEVRGRMNAMGPVTYFARGPLRSYFHERRAPRLLCLGPIAFILPWTSEKWTLFLKSTYPDLNYPKLCHMTCAPSQDSDQPGYPPCLIRVFVVRIKKLSILSYPLSAHRRLVRLGGSPTDVRPCLAHILFCWFCHAKAHKLIACGVDSY